MQQYKTFVSELDKLLTQTLSDPKSTWEQVAQVVDGRPAIELRRLVPLDLLRSSGAFFTGSTLSDLAIANEFSGSITKTSVILDPACGGGDLLLSCTPYLPRTTDLAETLALWQSNLRGIDLYPEFVRTTKVRLILQAIMLGAKPGVPAYDLYHDKLKGIEVGSTFENIDLIGQATHILLNPPYSLVPAPESCEWGIGKVNSAAIFLDACVRNSQIGTRVVAILPDVLRSGTRYEKWRKIIQGLCDVRRVELYGQFDVFADVDVFILDLIVKKETATNPGAWAFPANDFVTIGDKFDISVGPVVDYRDPHAGQTVSFIHSRGLPAWDQVENIEFTRRFAGRTITSPFVVVRRTSRLGDKFRAVGTIITSPESVAVENHLIILKPKDDNLSTCQDLLEVLKDDKTSQWLNQRIRCRHLTVRALAELPWWSEKHANE
jgi:hypothetical protein